MIIGFTCLSASSTFAREPLPEDSHPYFKSKLQFRGGGFYAFWDTKVRLDAANGALGTTVDFEETLNMDDSGITPYFGATWRITPRHKIGYSYFTIDRSGTQTLEETIKVGDETFTFGTKVNSSIEHSVHRVDYDYSFVNDGSKELSIGFAVDIMPINASIQEQNNNEANASITLPVPSIGVSGAFTISDKTVLIGSLRGLYIAFDQYQGDLLNIYLGGEYNLFKNFSVGAGYRYYSVHADVDYSSVKGDFDFNYNGPTFYANLHF